MPDTPHAKHVAQPQKPPADAQRKLEESKQQVLALLRDCQFSEVLVRLVPLTRPQGPGSEPYVAWAQQELTRLRALPPDVVQKGPTLVPEAIKLLAQQNFAQVIRLLDCIPPEFRPPEAVSVLQQARTLQGEVEQTGIPDAAGFTPAEPHLGPGPTGHDSEKQSAPMARGPPASLRVLLDTARDASAGT
jgi:hypothetical protein